MTRQLFLFFVIERTARMGTTNKSGICYIFGAGSFYGANITPTKDDFIIGADGGYAHCEKLNLIPNIVIGDFDSLKKKPDIKNLIELKPEKDDTDMMVAVKFALEKGYKTIYIYGGTGGRFDHTISNLQTLAYISKQGARGFLVGKQNTTTAITNTQMEFDKSMKGFVSVFSHDTVTTGVNLVGLKYPLENKTLKNDMPLGVSNEFMGKASTISAENGTLIIIYENQ